MAAEKQAEVNVLDEIAAGIDGDHQQQQPCRTEYARIAAVLKQHRHQHGQPQRHHNPIDERGDQLHVDDGSF
ncbi:hypothetical protein D3C83_148880 [compost metagenome]